MKKREFQDPLRDTFMKPYMKPSGKSFRNPLKRSLQRLVAGLLLTGLLAGPVSAAAPAGSGSPVPAAQAVEGDRASMSFVSADRQELPVSPSALKWVKVGNCYRLEISKGKYKTGMVKYKDKYYYFDAKGNLKVGFVTAKGQKYYASYVKGEKGKGQILTGLVKIGSFYYYLDPRSAYYPGAVAKGFQQISGRRYYFDKNGKMVTGWFKSGGYTYYGNLNKKAHYGALLTGVQKIGNTTYHFDAYGRLVTALNKDAGPLSARFPCICQHPELPTGCEITSLTMVLKYYGYPADKLDLADHYLDKGTIGRVSFWEYFLGNPRSNSSYGCYAPVIVKAANKYLRSRNSALRAHCLSGKTLESLASYTNAGIPVIIWSTIDCRPGYYTTTWVIKGQKLTWYAPEHCMVLVGFSGGKVLIADPIYGKVMAYDKEKFRKGYKGLYSQTVVLR